MQDIYIGDEGKGTPLVLIHGFLGSSEMWKLQVNFFKNYFRVITPDIPGFGKSNKAKSYSDIKSIAKVLLDCLKEKDINKFYLLGHSMGGMIVQEIVKISENRVKKLICFATGSIGDIPGRFEPLETTRERLKKDGLKETVNRVPQNWFVEGIKAKYYYFCENAVKNISIETADNALVAMKNWRGYENLKNIKQDTLIIWGDKDVSYNFNQVDTLKKNIPSSQLEIFKGCGHNVHLEEPQKFNETVKNFLS